MCVRMFLPLTTSPPGPKPDSVAPQAAESFLALGQDTAKLKEKTVEVTEKIRSGGSPWCQGKANLAVPEMYDTRHNVLECSARQGL